MNLLRPDLIIDRKTFQDMAEPNQFINMASTYVRGFKEGWKENAYEQIINACNTSWGKKVFQGNPTMEGIIRVLNQNEISVEERVQLISDIENMHTFSNLISRTRRRDIGEFTIRKPYTVTVEFTPEQRELHDKVLEVVHEIFSTIHCTDNTKFMMTTIRRQTASCLFGLAPMLRSILYRHLYEITDNDDESIDLSALNHDKSLFSIQEQIEEILEIADALPDEDPKFDALMEIVKKKQTETKNKLMIFSSFRHTLHYLYNKLTEQGLRVGLIHGDVIDEERRELRKRFNPNQTPCEDKTALDILLFSEVGCEGLDYQFCDCMVNYDLPWNPMKVEQRIGRIDRNGQTSESVAIYNMVTPGTVDADVLYGIYQNSIDMIREEALLPTNVPGEFKKIQEICVPLWGIIVDTFDDNDLRALRRKRNISWLAKEFSTEAYHDVRAFLNQNFKLETLEWKDLVLNMDAFFLSQKQLSWMEALMSRIESYCIKRATYDSHYIDVSQIPFVRTVSQEQICARDEHGKLQVYLNNPDIAKYRIESTFIKNESIRSFYRRALEIPEYNIEQETIENILPKYESANVKFKTKDPITENIDDLKVIKDAIYTNTSILERIKDKYIVTDGKNWYRPEEMYLRSNDTRSGYALVKGIVRIKYLADTYFDGTIRSLKLDEDFFKKIGCNAGIRMIPASRDEYLRAMDIDDYNVIYSLGRPEVTIISDVNDADYQITSGEVFNLERNHLNNIESGITGEIKEIHESTDYVNPYAVGDYDDGNLSFAKSLSANKYGKRLEELENYIPKPYSYRVDISADGATETYYIGASDVILKDGKKVISANSDLGYELINYQTIKIHKDGKEYGIKLSRQFDIDQASLYGYVNLRTDEDVIFQSGITDPFLVRVLNIRKKQHNLTDIFVTIQENQNKIVNTDFNKNIIVQGCAGSGKTMVLLHRLSALKYRQRYFDFSQNALILTPNEQFSLHIKGLAEGLQIGSVHRISVEQYYLDMLLQYDSAFKPENKIVSEMQVRQDYVDYIYSDQFKNDFERAYNDILEKRNGLVDILIQLQEAMNQEKKTISWTEESRFTIQMKYSVDALNDLLRKKEQDFASAQDKITKAEERRAFLEDRIPASEQFAKSIVQESLPRVNTKIGEYVLEKQQEIEALNKKIQELQEEYARIQGALIIFGKRAKLEKLDADIEEVKAKVIPLQTQLDEQKKILSMRQDGKEDDEILAWMKQVSVYIKKVQDEVRLCSNAKEEYSRFFNELSESDDNIKAAYEGYHRVEAEQYSEEIKKTIQYLYEQLEKYSLVNIYQQIYDESVQVFKEKNGVKSITGKCHRYKVFVVSAAMHRNEKYIAYTRALSELIVVVDEKLMNNNSAKKVKENIEHNKKAGIHSAKMPGTLKWEKTKQPKAYTLEKTIDNDVITYHFTENTKSIIKNEFANTDSILPSSIASSPLTNIKKNIYAHCVYIENSICYNINCKENMGKKCNKEGNCDYYISLPVPPDEEELIAEDIDNAKKYLAKYS